MEQLQKQKEMFRDTIMDKIFETNFSFHTK